MSNSQNIPIDANQYPVWASLACDHLAIMASSVTRKWAFSSAGITISKHQNQLKADIVKALQFIKCLIHCDLMFCADPSASLDNDLDEDGDILTYGDVPNTEQGWDELWLEDDDNTITDG